MEAVMVSGPVMAYFSPTASGTFSWTVTVLLSPTLGSAKYPVALTPSGVLVLIVSPGSRPLRVTVNVAVLLLS